MIGIKKFNNIPNGTPQNTRQKPILYLKYVNKFI